MPDPIDAARAVLESRLKEIDSEAARLRAALRSLGADSATGAPRRPANGRRPPTPAAKRARRGQRRTEFLAAVKKSPGATAAEISRAIGISTNQAYALSRRLLKDGEVKKQGSGYSSS